GLLPAQGPCFRHPGPLEDARPFPRPWPDDDFPRAVLAGAGPGAAVADGLGGPVYTAAAKDSRSHTVPAITKNQEDSCLAIRTGTGSAARPVDFVSCPGGRCAIPTSRWRC